MSDAADILIVDDKVENLRVLAAMLQDGGYEARPVRSGAEAIRAATNDPPELILLDIMMPEMDGYETCARLKETAGLEDIPVIFITALGELPQKVKAFAAGGVDYVTKPFQMEEVLARIRVHLELRRARVALAENFERLRTLERLRDELTHMLVHDMRSPMTALMASLQFLRLGVGKVLDGDALEDLESAAQAAAIINGMANDILDVSRMEEGKLPLKLTPTNLVEVAINVRSSLLAWDRDRKIELDARGWIGATCDAAVIRRVLENLVSNSIKHTPQGTPIRIALVAGPPVRISVIDQGRGVPIELRETIFERFGILAAREDHSYHSSGLGLAFCKLAVEAHGGRIGVDDREGGGSVFWFELPLLPGAPA